jgi:hypothetical protein
MKRLLAIDPGVNGGLAWVDSDGIVRAEKMPDGPTAIVDKLRELRVDGVDLFVVEKVGKHMPGNSGIATATFSRHCGLFDGVPYALGYSLLDDPLPNKWMKWLGGVPKDKGDRKRYIKEHMQRRYPHLRVTLATADALGILTWALGREK